VFSVIMPILVTLLLGILCREKHILTPAESTGIKKLAVNITLPAISLSAYLGIEYTARTLLAPLWIVAAMCLMLCMGYGARRLLKSDNRLLPFLCTAVEGGMLGFSLYPLLHTDLAPFSLIVAGNVFFIFTIYKVLISGAKEIREVMQEALHSPPLWALILGMALNVTGIYSALEPSGAQKVLNDTLNFVSRSTGFLILFTIGYDLDFRTIQWKKALTAFFCREIICGIMLCVTLYVSRTFLDGVIETDAALVMFMLPAPFVVNVFADSPENKGVLASSLSIMTCFTLVLFCILCALRT